MFGGRGGTQGGVWSRVSYDSSVKKGRSSWDCFPWGGRSLNLPKDGVKQDVQSFYVSEFPDSHSAKDLFDLFGCVGKVVEVSIAPRRNNVGKRFGFARFVDVESDRKML